MATWEARVSEFIVDRDPDSDLPVEVLCQDHNGTYALPFLCRLHSGVWLNAATGHAVDAVVVGWRVHKEGRRSKRLR